MNPSPDVRLESHRRQNHRWQIVALTIVNQALALGVMIYSFALFVVPWLEEFDISRGKAMIAITSLQIVLGLSSPVIGRMLDQYPMRWLVMAGAVCMAAGFALLSLADQYWQIILVHATLLPIGMLLCGTLASQTLVSKWFVENRGFAIGISSLGTSLGGLTIPLITAWLILQYEWQGALMLLAVVSLVLLLPLNFLILRFEPPTMELDAGGAVSIDQRAWTTSQILKSRAFWIPVIGLVPINAAFGGVQFNLGAYVADLGFEQALAAQLIAVTSATMIVGKLFFGVMSDRVDHRKLYWLMASLLVASLYFYQGSPGLLALIVAVSLQGFATGGVLPVMGNMYATRFGSLSFGRVMGFVNMFLMTGSFGSIFSGWIFDLTQSYDFAFVFFAGFLVPGIVALYFLPETADTQGG